MSHVRSLAHRTGVSFTLQDWNRDGRLDLCTGRSDWQTRVATRHVWLQRADGAFPPQPTATYRWDIRVAATEGILDLDADGRPELIVTCHLRRRWLPWMVIFPETQHSFVYRLGAGNAFQDQPTCHFTSNLVGHPTCFVDWNRDGHLDALTFHSLLRATSKEQIAQAIVDKAFGFSVGFHLAASGKLPTLPTFVKNFTYRLDRLSFPHVIGEIKSCADLNGDGRPDLLVETRPNHLEGYYQTPTGLSAQPDMELTIPVGCWTVITNDLNGDARADVVFVQPGGEDTRLTILLSKR